MATNDAVQARTTRLFDYRNTVHLSPVLIVPGWLEQPFRHQWDHMNPSSVKKGITVHKGERSPLFVQQVTSARKEPTNPENAVSDPIALPEPSRTCLSYP